MKNYKLSVDDYEVNEKTGVYTCQCYTPGDPNEKGYTEKTVTTQELKEHLCDKFGKIDVTLKNDWQSVQPVMFWAWINEASTAQVYDVLTDIINKREGRVELADLPEAFAGIAHFSAAKMPEDKVTRIVHHLRSRRA